MDPSPLTTSVSLITPRHASTWDSFPGWSSSGYAMASDISSRRVSETTDFPMPEYNSGIGNITRRKASFWDATPSINGAQASVWDSISGWHPKNPTASDISGRRVSEATNIPVSAYISGARNIAHRKASIQHTTINERIMATHDNNATAVMSKTQASVVHPKRDKPKRDKFADSLRPHNNAFELCWRSIVVDIATPYASSEALYSDVTTLDCNRAFYAGNIYFLFETHNARGDLAMADMEAILYIYGVDNPSALDMVKKMHPKVRRLFDYSSNKEILFKQILFNSKIKFSQMKNPLCILRHASKCYQENLLSPLYFSAYIVNVLKQRYLDFVPRFMILGMCSILGVLKGSTNRKLTTKDVMTFVRLWQVANLNEAQNVIKMINHHGGTISCWRFYNLLYRKNKFGNRLIDTQGQQNPSMFFLLMDKDDDGFLSSMDLRNFGDIFGRVPTVEGVDRVTRKLDMDGDGKISLEDFCEAMEPILDGITWEFWLVAILFTLDF